MSSDEINNNFSDIKATFLDNTHQLNNYNEIYNMNKYVEGIQNMEVKRKQDMNENLKSRIMKLKQEYMLIEYKRNALKMKANIMLFSSIIIALCFMCVSLFLMEKLNKTLTIIIVSVLIVFYIFMVIIIVKSNSHRRFNSWTQYYWSDMKKNT